VVDPALRQQLPGERVIARRHHHVAAGALERVAERRQVLHLRRVFDVEPDVHAASERTRDSPAKIHAVDQRMYGIEFRPQRYSR
jgi:hypothetical protein